MSFAISINSYVNRHQVLPLLGVEMHDGPMPMTVPCPLCRGQRLTLYNDTRSNGDWHYCPDCKASGDMISLAAKTWRCEVPDAIHRLADAGCPIPEEAMTDSKIAQYIHLRINNQERSRQLAQYAREELHSGDVSVNFILNTLGLPQDYLKPAWPKRMGRFMGAVHRFTALKAFYRPEKTLDEMTHRTRILSAKGWRDVLAIPFKALPDRYCGWLFIGRQGRKDADYDYYTLEMRAANESTKPEIEGGFCMYDVLDSQTAYKDRFDNNIFVINDPVHALKLQARHMRDSELPLPVVGVYNARIKQTPKRLWRLIYHEIWASRPDKRFIFWGPVLAPELFNMAARANGRVYVSNMPAYISRQPSHKWLELMQKKALHWMAALEQHLRVMPESKAVTLLNGLDIAPELLREFVEGCADDVKQIFENNKDKISLIGKVTVNNRSITEHDHGWYVVGKDATQYYREPECVSNAILRIEKVLCTDEASEDQRYIGRILMGELEVPFNESMTKIEKNPGLWLKKKMLADAGKFVNIKAGWNKHIVDIARQFHEPQVVHEDGRFGWKSSESGFIMPQFSVHVGGTLSSEPAHAVDEWAPGKELDAPAGPVDFAPLLDDTPSNRLFWATTACLAANILAPALGQPQAGLALQGHGALLVGRATARAHGCCELRGGSRSASYGLDMAEKIKVILERHEWPLIVNLDGRYASRAAVGPLFNGAYPHNVVMHMHDEQFDGAALTGPWRRIVEEKPIDPSGAIRNPGRHFMPALLRRVCGAKLRIEGGYEFVYNVAHEIARAMHAFYGRADVIEASYSYIDDGSTDIESRARYFVSLVYRLIESGDFRFMRARDAAKSKQSKVILLEPDDQPPVVFIPRKTFAQILSRRGIVLPDHAKVVEALKIGNALAGECEYNDEMGWLLFEPWWSKQVEACRSPKQRTIGSER